MAVTIYSFPPELILYISEFLDSQEKIKFYSTCKYFKNIFDFSEKFWKILCIDEKFTLCHCLQSSSKALIGFNNTPFRVFPDEFMLNYRKLFTHGVKMRRNFLEGNFCGWRIFAHFENRIIPISNDNDMTEICKLSKNRMFDNLVPNHKIIDGNYFITQYNSEIHGEIVFVYNIQNEPKFQYLVNLNYKAIDMIIVDKYYVILPSNSLELGFDLIVFDIENKMKFVNKFVFEDQNFRKQINENKSLYIHHIPDTNYVICRYRSPSKVGIIIIDIPSCNIIKIIDLDNFYYNNFHKENFSAIFSTNYLVQYFTEKNIDEKIIFIFELDGVNTKIKFISSFLTFQTFEFLPNKNSIYLLKKSGDISFYNLVTNEEKFIYLNTPVLLSKNIEKGFYHFLMNKQNIFLIQKNFLYENGRFIKVIDLKGEIQFVINLDLWRFNISITDFLDFKITKICILVICNTKILFFDIKNGKYIGQIPIFYDYESKDTQQHRLVKLSNTIVEEDQIIILHDSIDYYPAIVDIYRFY